MATRTKKQDQKWRHSDNEGAVPDSSRSGFSGNTQEPQAIPALEWIMGGIGFFIIACVLGFLLYTGINEDHPVPDVKLSVDSVQRIRNGYLVRVIATNEGGMTAAGVIVEGELRKGAEPVERSETVIEFLPSRSKKRAGLFFSRDPNQFELKLRPLGYEEQ
jgi:uncharacterized protein (TIGR02588 family)